MLACEQSDRICHMMESDKKNASVILRRMPVFWRGEESITVMRDG